MNKIILGFIIIFCTNCTPKVKVVDSSSKDTSTVIGTSNTNLQCQNEYDKIILSVEKLVSPQSTYDQIASTKDLLIQASDKKQECGLSTGSKANKIRDYCIQQAKSAEDAFNKSKFNDQKGDEDFKKRMDLYNELAKLIVDVQ